MPVSTPTLNSVVASWTGSWKYGGPKITINVTINDSYPGIVRSFDIERDAGSGYSVWYTAGYMGGQSVPFDVVDTSVEDGSQYTYRVRSFDIDSNPSSYSGTASAVTALRVTTVSGSAGPTHVTLSWNDDNRNETGYEIYRDGALIHTTGQNATSWTDTGLYSSHWYSYQVRAVNAIIGADGSNTLLIFTADPPNAPSGLTLTPTGTATMRLNWTDNADNETGFHVYRSLDGTNWSQIGETAANVTTYADSGLTSNTLYYYRVSSFNGSGDSVSVTPVSASTWAAIAQPTLLTVTPWGSGTLEITFQDNSTLEDGHSLEASANGSTGWAEVLELAPNRTYYQHTSLGAGTTKYYRVRARQGASYSAYSTIVSGTTLSTPGTPTALTVSEYQDKWARLTWTGVATAAGYKIEKSTDGGTTYAEIGRVTAGVEYYKVKNLYPALLYYLRIRAYNGAGNGSYTSAVTVTTRATYLESKFEALCRATKKNLIFLAELNPLKVVTGWTITSGKTYCYEYLITDAGIDFDALYENGVALTEKTSTATVESTVGSWWCDYTGRKLYVHSSTGANPVNFYYTGSVWLYFTTWQTGATNFNSHYYHPLVPEDGVPDVSAEIKPLWEGSFSTNIGSIQLINKKTKDGFLFDKMFRGFIWQNRPARVLAGGTDFAYSEFYPWATGTITDGASLTDARFTLPLRDPRDAMREIKLPLWKYSLDEFPLMDSSSVDKWRPFGFGVIAGAVPISIDTTSRVFEFHAGRCSAVAGCYLNGAALTGGTDYFIDYQRGRITLARGLAYATSDKITVSFTGAVDAAGDAIQTAAGIFLYGAMNFAGQSLAQLDLDSIYETMEERTDALGFHLYKDTDYTAFARRLESGACAFTFQDQYGRIGFRISPTAENSRVIYVPEQYISDFKMETGRGSRFKAVNVLYAENPSTETFTVATAELNTMDWGYGVKASVDITTALTTAAQADALKADIIALLDRPTASFNVKKMLYQAREGDLIYVSRGRYYSIAGSAANLLMQIIKIGKSTAGQVSITAIEAGDALAESEQPIIGVEWNQATDTWRNIDELGNTIVPTESNFDNHPIWGRMRRVNLASNGAVNAYKGDATYKADGTNGRVMVQIPRFYVKTASPSANIYQWYISDVYRAGYSTHPAFKQSNGGAGADRFYAYVGAYAADLNIEVGTIRNLHSRTGKQPMTGDQIWYFSFSGGQNAPAIGDSLSTSGDSGWLVVGHWLLTGSWAGDDATGVIWVRKPGDDSCDLGNAETVTNNTQSNTLGTCYTPTAESTALATLRGYAQAIGTGWNVWNVWEHAALRLLYYIEHCGANAQTEIGIGVSYKALGTGFAGELNGASSIDTTVGANGTGAGSGAYGENPIAYRGVENFWGNIWQRIEGFEAVDGATPADDVKYRIAKADGTTMFADVLATYDELAKTHASLPWSGYVSNIHFDSEFELLFLAAAVAGAAGSHLHDNWADHDPGEDSTLIVGGSWTYGTVCGPGCMHLSHQATESYMHMGTRLSFIAG